MKKRMIGNLEVSQIGMGCMGFSHGYGKAPSERDSIQAIHKAYEAGCTFFDTAESYGKEQFYSGHNEQLVGKAVESFRKKIILATKLHIHNDELNNQESLYDIVFRHLQQSLKNLRTDYIDLYYLHRINENIPVEDVAKVMGQLIQEGYIKGWGLSQVTVDTLDKAHHVTPVTAVQNLYSMIERDCEKEVIPYCLKHHIGVVAFSPIGSGFLSGKVTTHTHFEGDDVRQWVPQLSKENISKNQPIIELLNQYAQKKKATLAQISLAWMLYKYPHVVPIPGSKNQERILENLNASQVILTDEEFNQLEKALHTIEIYGHRGIEESEGKTFSQNWQK